jgi:microcystin-dependent protein
MEENRRVTARKRAYLWAGVTLATIVGAGALVFASVPHTFTNGETLTADNLNGNFSALDQRLTTLEALLPPGTIIAFGGPAGAATDGGAGGIPPGWLLCDGSAVSRATYASLFGAIGINFGGGDGITTFNLPDMRGRFLRGVDHGAGRDPDAANRAASAPMGPTGDKVGTLEGAGTAMPTATFATASAGDHTHPFSDSYYSEANCPGPASPMTREGSSGTDNDNNLCQFASTTSGAGAHTHGITGGDSETRPKNVGVNYLVKI